MDTRILVPTIVYIYKDIIYIYIHIHIAYNMVIDDDDIFYYDIYIPIYFLFTAAINLTGVTIFTVGAVIVIMILYLYVDTLRCIIKNAPPMVKTHSAFILSVYPVSYTGTRLCPCHCICIWHLLYNTTMYGDQAAFWGLY